MNFKEWLEQAYGKNGEDIPDGQLGDDSLLKEGWNACKNEVLDILNNNKRDCLTNSSDWLEYVRISVINEIEKL